MLRMETGIGTPTSRLIGVRTAKRDRPTLPIQALVHCASELAIGVYSLKKSPEAIRDLARRPFPCSAQRCNGAESVLPLHCCSRPALILNGNLGIKRTYTVVHSRLFGASERKQPSAPINCSCAAATGKCMPPRDSTNSSLASRTAVAKTVLSLTSACPPSKSQHSAGR